MNPAPRRATGAHVEVGMLALALLLAGAPARATSPVPAAAEGPGAAALPGYDPAGDPRERPQPGGDGLQKALEALGVDDLAVGLAAFYALPAPGEPGAPLGTLTPRQLLAFAAGQVEFARHFTTAQGLGPHFNEPSCGSCHALPALGGVGSRPEHVIHVHEPNDLPGETVGLRRQTFGATPPERAGPRRGRRRTPPLFGHGLLDALPEEAIAANADPGDSDGDGIAGVVNRKGRGSVLRPARFGAKCHEWNLWRFIGGAMRDEMGLTNTAAAGAQADSDAAADPEVDAATMRRIDAFVRGLAPLAPRAPTDRRDREALAKGKALFSAIGCVGCHRDALGGVQGVYSDLLLHDLGPGLDAGLDDGPAKARFWRTAPLWGLRHRPRLLHDERATDPAAAVGWHDGEAAKPKARFLALPERERRTLLTFLSSL